MFNSYIRIWFRNVITGLPLEQMDGLVIMQIRVSSEIVHQCACNSEIIVVSRNIYAGTVKSKLKMIVVQHSSTKEKHWLKTRM